MALSRVRDMAAESADALEYARMGKSLDALHAQIDRQESEPIPAVPVVLLKVGVAALEVGDAGKVLLPRCPAGGGRVLPEVVLDIVKRPVPIQVQRRPELDGCGPACRRL